jgi:hypothetical protein
MSNVPDEELSQDTLFSLLSNPRRRFVLQYLNRVKEPVSLQDLTTEVAAWENETDPEELTDKQEKRIYVSLYQTHIPKLEEAGIVRHDEETGEILLTDKANDVSVYLNGQVQRTRPWELYYLGLVGVGSVVFATIALGVAPVGELGATLVGLVWLVALAALSITHYTQTR